MIVLHRCATFIVPWIVLAFALSGTCWCQDSGSWQPPPTLESLPPLRALPDLLRFADGRVVEMPEQWEARRTELKAIANYFEYGHFPARPDKVTAEDCVTTSLDNAAGTQERMKLIIGSSEQLSMQVAITRPKSEKPLPVIVTEVHRISSLPCIPMLLEHGYMLVQYQREDLDPDQADEVGPAQLAYPKHDWATIAVWAWGAMRVVDYLETRDDVDMQHIAITGHSRGGKAALLAGAMDERFALVVPNGSGCGGAGCFRDTPRDAESLAQITDPKRFGYWFHPRLHWFADREERLPFDQHLMKALVAPRGLLCTEATGDRWANPVGTRRTSLAAQEVFTLLGVPEKNALHYRDGQHDQTIEDWRALLAFAQWHFFGHRPEEPKRFQQW